MGLIGQKLRAFSIHFAISLMVIGSFTLFTWLVVYTPEVMRLEGGHQIALLILAVDLTLGPLLTLILYRKGKRGMRFDLIMIAVLQTGAFLYGAWTLWIERPLYLAYVVEHFEIVPVAAIEGDTDGLPPEVAPDLWHGPRKVFVERPSGKEREEIMFSALAGGKDIYFYTKYYRPFSAHLDHVRGRAFDLDRLRTDQPQAVAPIEASLQRLGRTPQQVLLVPIRGHAMEGAVVLDRDSGAILDHVDAVIW